MIPHQLINLEEVITPNKCQPTFSQGGLRIGVMDETPNHHNLGMPISGSFYHDGMAIIQQLSSFASSNMTCDCLTSVIMTAYKDAMGVVQEIFPMNNQESSSYLDLLPTSDTRFKDKRIRSASEPRREKKEENSMDNNILDI